MSFADRIRKLRYVLMAALVIYCLNLCVDTLYVAVCLPYILRFVGAYFLFAGLGMLCPGRWRILPTVLGVGALVAPVLLYTTGNMQTYCLTHSVVYGVLLILTMRIGSWDHRVEVSGKVIVSGFALLCLCVLCATFYDPFAYLLSLLKLAAFVYSLLAVLSMNRRGWLLATGGKKGYSAVMRWKNRLLAWGMFVLALIPAWFISPIALFGKLWNWFRKMVAGYLEKIETSVPGEIIEIESEQNLNGGVNGGFPIPIKLLVLALMFVGVTFIAILVLNLIKDGSSRASYVEDFSDEVTRTRSKKEKSRSFAPQQEQAEEQRRMLFFSRMTPAQKIRYRYRQLARKHPEWKLDNTARENLADRAAGIYEEARYSEHPISDSQVDSFKKETKKR